MAVARRNASASATCASSFATIDEALDDLREGKMVIVCDDEDRENEGDLTHGGPVRHRRARSTSWPRTAAGSICLALTPSAARSSTCRP